MLSLFAFSLDIISPIFLICLMFKILNLNASQDLTKIIKFLQILSFFIIPFNLFVIL